MIADTFQTIFTTHSNVVLWCSGGKDSLTLLHLLKPYRDKICVLHMYEPDEWPQTMQNLNECMDAWGFLRNVHLEPQYSFEEYVDTFGWPVDVIPSVYDGTGHIMSPYWDESLKMANPWHCSVVRQIYPLAWCSIAMKADAVLTGSRGQDGAYFATHGAVQDAGAWTRYNPLQDWTTDDVYAYVDEWEIPLPPHYVLKRERRDFEWVDCLSCTWSLKHWEILKEHYPEEFEKRWPAAREVFVKLKEENAKLSEELSIFP